MPNPGQSAAAQSAAEQATKLLKEALIYVDSLGAPHIGARLQEIIVAIAELGLA
jgi:hypothetical protein